MLNDKDVFNARVRSYKNKYRYGFTLAPSVNSAIVPNNGAGSNLLKVLKYQEMFGQVPKSLIIKTMYDDYNGQLRMTLYYF